MSGSSDARPRHQRRRTDQRLRAIVSPALIALLRIYAVYAKRRQVYAVLHSNDQPPPGSQRGEPAPAYETAYRRWTIPIEAWQPPPIPELQPWVLVWLEDQQLPNPPANPYRIRAVRDLHQCGDSLPTVTSSPSSEAAPHQSLAVLAPPASQYPTPLPLQLQVHSRRC